MPAADGRRRTVRAGAAVVERLERRRLCADAGAQDGFGPVAGDLGFYQLAVDGRVEPAGDEDWFALGRLRAGDVVSVGMSGAASGRGTLWDPLVGLYRVGGDPSGPQLVARDNDGGGGLDALVLQQTLAADGEYFVRATVGSKRVTGSYTLTAWVETRGGRPGESGDSAGAPGGGESEPNGGIATASQVAPAWRPVGYVAAWEGEIGAGVAEEERTLDLRAGDLVTVQVDSTAALDAAVAVLDEAGKNVLAVDRGDSNRRSGDIRDARVYAVRLPQSGVYRVRTWGHERTEGPYGVKVYLSRDEPSVVGRHVFYNNSIYDEKSAHATPADDAALAPDKAALLPGQASTLANVTNYSAGINGIMIDVKDLHAALGEGDFEFEMSRAGMPGEWVDAPRPASVTQRAGAGIEGSARVAIVWPDGTIVNRWLRVTLKASAANGLAADDVFCFGNLAGETGDDPAAASVTAVDIMRTRAVLPGPPDIRSWLDVNRDGRVNALDQAVARAHLSRRLPMFTAPATQTQPLPAFIHLSPHRADRCSRRLRYEPTPLLH